MEREEIRLDEINYRGLCMDLLKNCWMILLTAAAVWLAATGIGEIFYTPQYSASATLVVRVKGSQNAYSSLATANQMAGVFSEVFQSDALREKIVEDMGSDPKGSISCTSIEETNLIVLRTTAEDPRSAYLFLHSALQNYEEVSEYVFANASLEMVQEPSVPSRPSNGSVLVSRRNLLACAGALGMAVIIALFYLFRYTVKSSAAAANILDGAIQGVIPYEKKGRKRRNAKEALLLTSSLVSMNFAEASRRMEAKVEYYMRRQKKKVLFITSVRENEGKSTVAANIALALAEKHKKVLLLDGDFKKPAQAKIFDVRPEQDQSFERVLLGEKNWREIVLTDKKTGLKELFLAQPVMESSQIMDTSGLERLIEDLKQEMDYIVIDGSPTAVSTDAELWMHVSDAVLLVVRQDWSDARVINDTVDLIWQTSGGFVGFALNAFREEQLRGHYGYGYKSYGYGYSNAERGK